MEDFGHLTVVTVAGQSVSCTETEMKGKHDSEENFDLPTVLFHFFPQKNLTD